MSGPEYIALMARHLPPSAAQLHLLDVGGWAGPILQTLRGDLLVQTVPADTDLWPKMPAGVDAVVAYDYLVNPVFLHAVLHYLRPGGRLIVLDPAGQPDEAHVRLLESCGFVRILVEAVAGSGVLIRGERAHETDDTLARIQLVAGQDAAVQDLSSFRGRYVHLLVRQTPNLPPWRLAPGQVLHWHAAALERPQGPALLAFSSLPAAVGLMQPAVMQGLIRDVSRVVRFRLEVARNWPQDLLLNPTLDLLTRWPPAWVEIDPATAEAPTE